MKKTFLATVLGVGLLAGGTLAADAQIAVRIGPPPPRREVIPPPRPGYVWHPGYHRWDGGRYVWVPGEYAVPPRPGAYWVPGHWAHRPGGYVWIEGHYR
ncbi:YXWGXW repeat-containing protein [Granulicella cerasi]|uniref:YXWGXW repeat-containing protein n=1 Tax=Granulicella cerasi TaxID=741063 RepID=A0ABW1ZBX3_9BACT|nr:YXWGXW repeat-containing protein [Granulicella cerasi]